MGFFETLNDHDRQECLKYACTEVMRRKEAGESSTPMRTLAEKKAREIELAKKDSTTYNNFVQGDNSGIVGGSGNSMTTSHTKYESTEPGLTEEEPPHPPFVSPEKPSPDPIPKKNKRPHNLLNPLRAVLSRTSKLAEAKQIGEDLAGQCEGVCRHNYQLVAMSDALRKENGEVHTENLQLSSKLFRAESDASFWKGKYEESSKHVQQLTEELNTARAERDESRKDATKWHDRLVQGWRPAGGEHQEANRGGKRFRR